MHEYSIVQALIDQCEEIAQQNEASRVIKVILKIGVLSGVEIHLLHVAFDAFKEGSVCNDAELLINTQKIKIACLDCGHEEELDAIEYVCKQCRSDHVKVIDGEDMYLMRLEME